jgi:general secretion pathway protein H
VPAERLPLPLREGAGGRGQDSGFTLLEMLAVLAILGLAVGLVLTRGPVRSPALEARATADSVAQALRAARAQAIAEGRPVAFVLDARRHEYVTEGARPVVLPVAPAVTITAPASGIRFAPDGSSSGGRIGVEDQGHVVSVSVAWLTGRVTTAEVGR